MWLFGGAMNCYRLVIRPSRVPKGENDNLLYGKEEAIEFTAEDDAAALRQAEEEIRVVYVKDRSVELVKILADWSTRQGLFNSLRMMESRENEEITQA